MYNDELLIKLNRNTLQCNRTPKRNSNFSANNSRNSKAHNIAETIPESAKVQLKFSK